MAIRHRFFTGLGILLSIFVWEYANGYGGKSVVIRPDQNKMGTGKAIDLSQADVAYLITELDRPRPIMTMAARPLTDPDDVDCPLTLCNHVKGIVLVPNRPRLFVACLPKMQFCGLCPLGTVLQADDHSFQCIPSSELSINDTDGCQLDPACQTGLRSCLTVFLDNETKTDYFTVCSKKRSFCGFCQADFSSFNRSTLTCDLKFPETRFFCPLPERSTLNGTELDVHPDPLTPCSSVAYICLAMKRRGISIRCPNPKMRYSKILQGCDLPDRIPECGGVIQSNANETLVELPLNSTQQVIRSPATNCVYRCMHGWGKPKNYCMRICTT